MNAILGGISRMLGNTGGRLLLGAVLSAAGAAGTAQAHPDIDLRVDLRGPAAEIEQRHWVGPVYEDRETRVWVEPVYQTVPGPNVWVEPVYRTVTNHVWVEPVTRIERDRVWVPEHFEERRTFRGNIEVIRRVFVPGHYELRDTQVIVTPGHYDDVCSQELVSAGHFEPGPGTQVLVTPGHFETRVEHVLVRDGHWEERPIIRFDAHRDHDHDHR